MGVQALVKGTLSKVKRDNTTNASTARLWERRVTDIASDLERTNDTAKAQELQRIVETVAATFDQSDGAKLGPAIFQDRNKALLTADVKLNALQAPPENRDVQMEEAVQKDYKKFDRQMRAMLSDSVSQLQQIARNLPNRKELIAMGRLPEGLKEELGNFYELQNITAEIGQRIRDMQDENLIDKKIQIGIFKLEDPSESAIYTSCDVDDTFGELIFKALGEKSTGGEDGDDDEDDDGDELPDVWMRRWDPAYNTITKSSYFWDYQDPTKKIQDALPAHNNADPDSRHRVDIIAKKGDYILALVSDNGAESSKAIDLPNGRKMKCTDAVVKNLFKNHKVTRVLEFPTGVDASQKPFHKCHVRPQTMPLYIELQPITGEEERPVGQHGQTM